MCWMAHDPLDRIAPTSIRITTITMSCTLPSRQVTFCSSRVLRLDIPFLARILPKNTLFLTNVLREAALCVFRRFSPCLAGFVQDAVFFLVHIAIQFKGTMCIGSIDETYGQ